MKITFIPAALIVATALTFSTPANALNYTNPTSPYSPLNPLNQKHIGSSDKNKGEMSDIEKSRSAKLTPDQQKTQDTLLMVLSIALVLGAASFIALVIKAIILDKSESEKDKINN